MNREKKVSLSLKSGSNRLVITSIDHIVDFVAAIVDVIFIQRKGGAFVPAFT